MVSGVFFIWAPMSLMLGSLSGVYSSVSWSVSFYSDRVSLLLLFISWWCVSYCCASSLATCPCICSLKMATLFSSLGLLSSVVFTVKSVLWLFISFEATIIPMSLIILGWGPQLERVMATMSMIMYTLVGSTPLLALLVFKGSSSLEMTSYLLRDSGSAVLGLVLAGFLVKTPVYFLHSWLPKAHVEAPTSGSMFLASILLKLGTYGLLRFSGGTSVSIATFCLIGGLMSGVLALSLLDLKMIVAFSSILHMAPCAWGLVMSTPISTLGSVYLFLSHSAVSAGLFYLVACLYSKVGSRSVLLVKSLILCSPILCSLWAGVLMLNISVPPFLGFLGELMLFKQGLATDWVSLILLCFVGLLSLSVCILLYSSVAHGPSMLLWPCSPASVSCLFLGILALGWSGVILLLVSSISPFL